MRHLKGACTHCGHAFPENSLAKGLLHCKSLTHPGRSRVIRPSLNVSIRLNNSLKRVRSFVLLSLQTGSQMDLKLNASGPYRRPSSGAGASAVWAQVMRYDAV